MTKRKLGILLSYSNTVLNMICGLFLSAYLLRMLGQTDYGIYQTICSFANYLVLLEFGTGTVITRNIARCKACGHDDEIQKNISTVFTVSLILSVLLVVVSALFYKAIPTIYKNTFTVQQVSYSKKIFGFETAYLLFSFFSNIPQGIMLGFEKYETQPLISIVRLFLRTTLLVFLVYSYRTALVIVLIDMILSFAVLMFDLHYCHTRLNVRFSIKEFDKKIFIDALPLSMAIMLQCIVNQANNNVDKFILGIKLSPADVAVYSVGLYVYSIFSSLATIPISMYAPQVIKEVEKESSGIQLENLLIKPSRLIVLVGGTIVFGFFSVGKQFLTLVYGSEYTIAWIVTLIIMLPALLNMSNGILVNVLDAKNMRMSRSFVLLFTTGANIVLTLLWVDRWGMIGASVATAICTIVGQIFLMNVFYLKVLKINVWYMYRETFKGILIYQILAAIGGYFMASLIENSLTSFLAGGIAYVLIFGLLFYAIGDNKEEKATLASILKNKKTGDN